MIILGLTGSIGMGKTTVALFFSQKGVPIFNADDCVHALYETEEVQHFIEKNFPSCLEVQSVNRKKLGAIVFHDAKELKKLEAFILPLLSIKEQEFIKESKQKGKKMILMDLPLLFEKKKEKLFDKIIVVTAPFCVQKERVLARKNMTEEKFIQILQKQMPNEEKLKRADYIIDTSMNLKHTENQVEHILSSLEQEIKNA